VTESVVGAIAPAVEKAEIERAKRKPTESLDAYALYLRGLAKLYQFAGRQAIDEALRLFNSAIELDPDFASAYARAAFCYVWAKGNGWISDTPNEIAEVTRLAQRAVELGKDDAIALAAGGWALVYVGSRSRGRWLNRPRACAELQFGRGMVLRRLGKKLARRAGNGDRALRTCHAPEPT
jgi:tetratricopeptide (TPR) repeat protein